MVKNINHPIRCKRGTPPDEKSGQALLAGGETFVLPGLFVTSKYEMKYIYFSSFEKRN